MKRFITYLYEYEKNLKTKNAGFIRVDERKGIVSMQVSIRKLIRSHEKGKVYALAKTSSMQAVELGEIEVVNGQGDMQIQFSETNIKDSSISLGEIAGIGIWFASNGYLASCWKDEAAEEIERWNPWQVEVRQVAMSEEPALEVAEQLDVQDSMISRERVFPPKEEITQKEEVAQEEKRLENFSNTPRITYQKMELNQIRSLPSKNWYLCNNRFLQHGFWGYGYLVLKKEISDDKEVVSLGVPGIYEEPEMAMATLFGFPKFQTLPVEIQTAPMNLEVEGEAVSAEMKSQKHKSGTFGCWLIPLQV